MFCNNFAKIKHPPRVIAEEVTPTPVVAHHITLLTITMDSNPEIELARSYIEFTNQNVFLTGKAGTGKTTFLRNLRNSQPKRMAVVAPTGVAAINAQGVTIHSFFQIAPGLFMPDAVNAAEQRKLYYRMSEQKKNILRTLDLLVIDEISMVRCDLLDAVDQTLRSYRDKRKPFGGVQLLFIGDLQQLAPVARDQEWDILKTTYDTPYFFSSKALQQTPFVTIELKKIYRQDDRQFIDLLNQIRTNTLSDQMLEMINRRCIPNFQAPEDEDWIMLTTHNHSAQSYNRNKLAQLTGKSNTFKAEISGNFPETSYPADQTITLRVGAQVMFIKNDPSPRHEYYNGKIGRVADIGTQTVTVECRGDLRPIVVGMAEWANTRYELDAKTGELRETQDGTFRQIPLRLAWAITIHKSQGLTFDHAMLDVNHSFAHGQTYVALSRCRSLQGLVLNSPLYRNSIISDQTVEEYIHQSLVNSTKSPQLLPAFEQQYFIELLNELFSFDQLSQALTRLMEVVKKYAFLSQRDFVSQLEHAEHLFSIDMPTYSNRFAAQYTAMATQSADCAHDPQIQQRVKAAAKYFLTQICDTVTPLLALTNQTFTNKLAKKQFGNALKQLTLATRIKVSTLHTAIEQGMTIKTYLNSKAVAEIVDINNLLADKATPQTDPAPQPTGASDNDTPQDPTHAPSPDTDPKPQKTKKAPKPKVPKTPTIEITLQMFRGGLTPTQIAQERKLTIASIEKHLVELIKLRKIAPDEIIEHTRLHNLCETIKKIQATTQLQKLSEIKAALPGDFSYNEIVIALTTIQQEI